MKPRGEGSEGVGVREITCKIHRGSSLRTWAHSARMASFRVCMDRNRHCMGCECAYNVPTPSYRPHGHIANSWCSLCTGLQL